MAYMKPALFNYLAVSMVFACFLAIFMVAAFGTANAALGNPWWEVAADTVLFGAIATIALGTLLYIHKGGMDG